MLLSMRRGLIPLLICAFATGALAQDKQVLGLLSFERGDDRVALSVSRIERPSRQCAGTPPELGFHDGTKALNT